MLGGTEITLLFPESSTLPPWPSFKVTFCKEAQGPRTLGLQAQRSSPRPFKDQRIPSESPPPAYHSQTHFCLENCFLTAVSWDGISYIKIILLGGNDKCCTYAEKSRSQ